MPNSNQSKLDQLRHSAAHLLAAAVLDLYPDAKLAIGPSIENGFYYDIDFPEPVSDTDLKSIEKRMKKIVNSWQEFVKHPVTKSEALKEFENNPYKRELIEEFASSDQELTIYQSGQFRDLCRGGHVDNPSQVLKHFKLLSLAGAYWRGNEKNPMLTRIYGTAFFSQEELDAYLNQLEEAKKRDHKILGPALDLFVFSLLVGPGLPLWTPKGTLLRNLLDDFVWQLRQERGYQKVEIPHITKKELYQTSGHWDKFQDELFKIITREGHEFAMKPMNCPHHTQIYASRPRSYKELPIRYANTTACYRDEQTGELSGLSRVRAFSQDDAHVFCSEDQVVAEASKIWDIIEAFYAGCGFPQLKVRLSLHDPKQMDKYLGSEDVWLQAETQLRELINHRGVEFYETVGEAAFYGPKIDFMTRDSLGREWQVATIQVDRNMPARFQLDFTNNQGNKEPVVMIHAAIMGSIERFLSILIEHFAGAFPLWMSPLQVALIPISDDQLEYASVVAQALGQANLRYEIFSGGSMQKRIRLAEKLKVPYMLILGDQEAKANTVSLRRRGQQDLGSTDLNSLIKNMVQNVDTKSLD